MLHIVSRTLLLLCLLGSHITFSAPPEVVLLKEYHPAQPINGWVMSEKLDGVRAIWNGKKLVTRQGNRLAAPAWFVRQLPPFPLDGELWAGRKRFEQTLSIVSRKQPHAGWHNISYQIFELPGASGNLFARLERLTRWLEQHPVTFIKVVQQIPIRDQAQLQSKLKEVLAAGGEGLVLRDPQQPYHTGRSNTALKLKPFQDAEAIITGYRTGKGRLTGLVGALLVRTPDGREFAIGSGLSDKLRRDPPSIGTTITYRYRGLTNSGLPRFASFLRLRPQ